MLMRTNKLVPIQPSHVLMPALRMGLCTCGESRCHRFHVVRRRVGCGHSLNQSVGDKRGRVWMEEQVVDQRIGLVHSLHIPREVCLVNARASLRASVRACKFEQATHVWLSESAGESFGAIINLAGKRHEVRGISKAVRPAGTFDFDFNTRKRIAGWVLVR